MSDLLAQLTGKTQGTPLSKAQAVLDRAYDEPDPEERAKLARKALELSPDLADAYILLGDQAKGRKEALELFEQAVAAGERAIGPKDFQEYAGHFWGFLETRPYMRARERFAHALWASGRREEAVEHLNAMLQLNPNDNQGVRYALAAWLLDLDRDEDATRLLERYDEPTATCAYTKALLAFRGQGDSPGAKKLLKAAQKQNKHVPDYLLGEEPLPPEMPDSYSIGDPSEAVIYAGTHLSAWRSTTGALTWLRDSLKRPKKKRAKTPKAAGPSDIDKESLRRLPRQFDSWQVDCRPLAHLVEDAGALVSPWVGMVASVSNGMILAQSMSVEPPTPELMWDLLAEAMRKPMMEEPYRPSEIQVPPGPIWDDLRPHLEEIEVECVEVDELEQIDMILDQLTEHLSEDEPPGLLDMPGMKPDQVASFYRAAAHFYRKTPWKKLGFEEVIRVDCSKFESGPWYAVVMGQSGLTLGVALYEDIDLLRKMWAGDLSDEENARETVALTATFDPEMHVPAADLLAGRQHGWEVAGPEAYPTVFKKERGLSMRPPLAWELELLEGCLRAIPEFVAKHHHDDSTPYEATVPVASGMLTLVLSRVEDV